MVGGALERVALSPEQSARLRSLPPRQRVQFYAALGLGLDWTAQLTSLYRANPRDRFLARSWAQLLQAAGLQGLTDADFADWELRSGGANP